MESHGGVSDGGGEQGQEEAAFCGRHVGRLSELVRERRD